MFIRPDEHIIIMDQGSNLLMPDELVMLRDAGIQTIYYQGGVNWHRIQPRPGVWDFGDLDARVDEYEEAGIKACIGFFTTMPYWKPDSWYFSKQRTRIFSYTDPQAADDIDELATRIIERYKGRPVQLVYAMPFDGEFIMSFGPGGGRFPIPDSQIADFIVARQRILEAQHNEIWSAFHFSCFPTFIGPAHKALRETFPDSNHYSLQYTYWPHPHNVQEAVRTVQEMFGVKFYVGSEYIQGMKQVAPHAIAHGVRLITSPIHAFQQYRRIEPWMLDVIRETLAMYEEAYA